ncbi:MAG: hypothetical protein ACYC3X_15665 [Pirellulaceae bacterium]
MPSSDHPWEFGSEFHWPFIADAKTGPVLPAETVLLASGRDAFRALIEAGQRVRGWRRWFVPTYFCKEVLGAIAATGIDVVRYEDSPLRPTPPPLTRATKPGDALLLVNYFGLRGADAAEAIDIGPADLIEDHTHDPWSRWALASRAQYCITSFRKTLPIPCGAAVWSPRRLMLPEQAPPTRARHNAVLMKLGAMMLKALYLEGQAVGKESYRALQLLGEEGIASGEISGLDPLAAQVLDCLPWESWRRQRRDNHAVLAEALREIPSIEVLPPSADTGSCSFAVIVMFPTSVLREMVRTDLIASSIYPAVLWPISCIAQPELAAAGRIANRMLALACDFRYGSEDLLRVAARLRAVMRSRVDYLRFSCDR